MHEHCHCYHDLRYCSICDCVYCKKCGKEWGKNYYCGNSGTWTVYNPANSGTLTNSSVSTGITNTAITEHKHE